MKSLQITTIVVLSPLLLIGQGNVGEPAEPRAARDSRGIRGVWRALSVEGAGVLESKGSGLGLLKSH